MKKIENYVIIILATAAIYLYVQMNDSKNKVEEFESRAERVEDSLKAIIDSSNNNILNQQLLIDSLDNIIVEDDSLLAIQKIKYNAIENKFLQQDSDTSFNFIVNYIDSVSARRDGTIERSFSK